MEKIKYKQICFNELTLMPLCDSETEIHDRIATYAKTFKAAQERLGTRVVRYPLPMSKIFLSNDMSFQQYCYNHRREPGIIALLSSHTMPLEDYSVDNQIDLESKPVTLIKETIEIESASFLYAYAYGVPCIGFLSEDFWGAVIHNLRVVNSSTMTPVDVQWPCLSVPEHLEREDFQLWLSNREEVELVPAESSYEEKITHIEDKIRDDHGKDVLIKHAKLLCRNEYVQGIITSLPFHPKFSDYIYRVSSDGLIDVVLYRDDRGLSMRVKTTGRTVQETTKIASILKKCYYR